MKARRTESLLREQARTGRVGLEKQFPDVFHPPLIHRAVVVGFASTALALFLFGLWRLGFSVETIWGGLGRLGDFIPLMLPPNPETWARAVLYLQSLGETMAIAFLGTLGAALIAFPLSIFAARTVVSRWFLRWPARRAFNALSGVDTLIWALIWINVVGLGPFAGVLAVMTSDIGALGRLFSEALESADARPVEGVVSTGRGTLSRIRFGLIPQVLPVMASQVLYFFESNTRSATIIGIVGAGGIGVHLSEQIRLLEWQHVSFLVLLILLAVMAIDWISTRLRFAIMGRAQSGGGA
ncbi:phosphonate ABC transporter, permease protein PhnE [Falsiroseomonas sp.]|jgi:phosphonate transport system permease protein|uniref:phosphonate ABC transporter, permease protein PhnE n=1 Tax=Falsiroseomonas sp. TaxID=2870721 RepID=UPI0034A515BE